MINFTKRYIENGKVEAQRPALVMLEGLAGYGKTTCLRSYVQRVSESGLDCAVCCSSANDWEKHVPLVVFKDIFYQIATEAGYGDILYVNEEENRRVASVRLPTSLNHKGGKKQSKAEVHRRTDTHLGGTGLGGLLHGKIMATRRTSLFVRRGSAMASRGKFMEIKSQANLMASFAANAQERPGTLLSGMKAIGADSTRPHAVEDDVLEKKVETALHTLGLHKDDDPNVGAECPSMMAPAVEDAVILVLRKMMKASNCVVVLVFDNMEFVDEASWKILYSISKLLKNVIIVGTMTTQYSSEKWTINSSRYNTRVRSQKGRNAMRGKGKGCENIAAFASGFKSLLLRIDLKPLASQDGLEIVKNVLGIISFPEAVWEAIHDVAEGNPVFYEQVAKALVEAGKIDIVPAEDVAGESETQIKMRAVLGTDESNFELPSTLQNLVTMRVDMLSPMQQKVGLTSTCSPKYK